MDLPASRLLTGSPMQTDLFFFKNSGIWSWLYVDTYAILIARPRIPAASVSLV